MMRTNAIADTATAEKWIAATVHPLATEAAVDVFREGGNAVDAAIAGALTLGVVDGFNSGIGGGCLILIRTADGQITAIDGREMAPGAATKDMFVRDGKPIPHASTPARSPAAFPAPSPPTNSHSKNAAPSRSRACFSPASASPRTVLSSPAAPQKTCANQPMISASLKAPEPFS